MKYNYPNEPVPPGKTAQGHLEDIVQAGLQYRIKGAVPDKIQALVDKELALIHELGYAHYFLTVHDIVAWARKQGILCQGRGSDANSAVCYYLGVTAVDPEKPRSCLSVFFPKNAKNRPILT